MGIFDKGNLGKQSPQNDESPAESYLLGTYDQEKQEVFYVIAKNRQDLGKLLLNMSNDRFLMLGIQLLGNVEDYNTLLKNLIKNQKPDDMEFGDNKEKGVE